MARLGNNLITNLKQRLLHIVFRVLTSNPNNSNGLTS